ncbi:MAG: hypothetical protein GXO37_02780 [Chloroflexi bacterium]|nr:hypothetical protein [Chloroflexota bacterium]
MSTFTPSPRASTRRGRTWIWIGAIFIALLTVCLGCGGLFVAGVALLPGPTPVPPEPVASSTPAAAATEASTEAPTPATDTMTQVPFRAVVQIVALDEQNDPVWTGSGSIISPDGLILTNAHIALPTADDDVDAVSLLILVTEREDRPPQPRYFAEVLQADWDLDLAVLRVARDLQGRPVPTEGLNLPYLPLGSASELRLGDELVILGYPGIGGDTITLTKGEVAGFIEDPPYGPRAFIKTTATLAGGNSGGAALNARGELVAVPTRLGAGEDAEVVDCRVLVDTNHDGVVDERDACVPIGGFINALRPVDLAQPLVEAARQGRVARPTAAPSSRPTPTRGLEEIWRHPGPVLEQDALDTPTPGWTSDPDDPEARIRYADGAMYVTLLNPNFLHTFTTDLQIADVVVKIKARLVRPVEDGDFGLLCRYQDINTFYAAALTADGYYYIGKMEAGEFDFLSGLEPLPPEAAFEPTQWNEIGLICFGPHLALWVNDYPVALISDTSLRQPGDAGLFVGTLDHGDFEVAFDEFEVRAARR